MSTRYTLAGRTPLLNGLFAGLACALTLAVTAGPAFADPQNLGRVEVQGRVFEAPLRYDVRAACRNIDDQLQLSLERLAHNEGLYGQMQVQMVLNDQGVEAVQARGLSPKMSVGVRQAVRQLQCGPQVASGPQIYRFNIAFVDPYAPTNRTVAAATGDVQVLALGR